MRLEASLIKAKNNNYSMSLEKNPKTIVVKDIMTKSVVSVDHSITINEAAKVMEDTKVWCDNCYGK